LHGISSTEKVVERLTDVGIILNDDNSLILDLAGHLLKISHDPFTARTISLAIELLVR